QPIPWPRRVTATSTKQSAEMTSSPNYENADQRFSGATLPSTGALLLTWALLYFIFRWSIIRGVDFERAWGRGNEKGRLKLPGLLSSCRAFHEIHPDR